MLIFKQPIIATHNFEKTRWLENQQTGHWCLEEKTAILGSFLALLSFNYWLVEKFVGEVVFIGFIEKGGMQRGVCVDF